MITETFGLKGINCSDVGMVLWMAQGQDATSPCRKTGAAPMLQVFRIEESRSVKELVSLGSQVREALSNGIPVAVIPQHVQAKYEWDDLSISILTGSGVTDLRKEVQWQSMCHSLIFLSR